MWAHSINRWGVRHSLVDHLRGTAELAEGFSSAFGAGDAGRVLGLAHDAGKASCVWQDGLLRVEAAGGRVGLDHKALGVYLTHPRLPLSQWILHGHHGGLTNRDHIGQRLKGERADDGDARRERASGALRPLLPELFDTSKVVLPAGFETGTDREMLVRFLFSALVDADGLDTAAHRLGLARPQVAAPADMEQLWDRFSSRRAELLAARAGSPVDASREGVYQDCLAAAAGPVGMYRLPAPTGSGKTLAGAAFAVRHAALHGKSRVIVAVPYITITEQNAAVYRSLLDASDPRIDPVVLEHHSSVDLDTPAEGMAGRMRWARLAAENWDAPFVVTTTVQLFESLFARRPARMRKVHRLANAVIVLDEEQALPHLLLPPVLDALRVLTQRFGTTVLLASATQPEWWELSPLRDVQAWDVITDPAPLYAALQRVTYQWWTTPKPTLAQVAERAGSDEQALVVVNTVADARNVATALSDHAGTDSSVFHLSTAMCALHRRDVLDAVRHRLTNRSPVHLVSTQLIEAGVDVDFPVVYRAVAPADSLQQAAGRANREGRLGPRSGRVVIFDPADGGQPPAYRTQVGVMRTHMGPGKADPDNLDALAATYRDLYQALDVEGAEGRAAVIQKNRAALDFLAVTDGPRTHAGGDRDRALAFRLIDEDTVPIAVPYGSAQQRERVDSLIAALRASDGMDPVALRELQPWTTTLRRATATRPEVAALCRPVVGDLLEWLGPYDQRGLVLESTGQEFIV
jgi:CRISPR-associated endonuclease/helicase Cas3